MGSGKPTAQRDPAVTSRMMAAVRNKDSKAELALRRELHARGMRFRLHARDVPGRPDLVIRKYRLAVFVDGDFWHGNAWRLRGLSRFEDQFPSNQDFWVKKIRRNMERDAEVTAALVASGWAVVRVWESEVFAGTSAAADRVESALRSRRGRKEGSEPLS
jgi:DNA mismatch endonuclease (patch repair protein)